MKSLLSLLFGIAFAGGLVAFAVRDELRLGDLSGRVVMTESSVGLPNATVTLYSSDANGYVTYSRQIETGDDGEFRFGRLPVGSYSISAYAKAHRADEFRFSVLEGEKTELTLKADPGDPYLRMFAARHVFLPTSEPEVTVEGFGQDEKLDITLHKIDFDKVVKAGGLQSIINTAWRWDDKIRVEDPEVFTPVADLSRPIERRDVEGAYVEVMKVPALDSGMYWVSARAGKSLRSGTYLVVSNVAMVTKRNGREVSLFVTHMETGMALANATVSIIEGETELVRTTTDGDGLATMQVPPTQGSRVVAVATVGDQRAVVPIYLYGRTGEQIRTEIVTDRPVYRPGHTIQFKGISRQMAGSEYRIPEGKPVQIRIEDPDYGVLKRIETTTDEFGGFSGSFQVESEAPTGWYHITAQVAGGEEWMHSVEVASYRKPEFEVTVVPDKSYFVRGERIRGSVSAQYYFGGPVPEAEVEIAVSRRPHYGEYEEYFAGYYGDSSGEYLGYIDAVTDGQGIARFTYDTSSLRDPESDYVYTFEAWVATPNGRTFSGSGSFRVNRGELDVTGVASSYVVEQGDDAEVNVHVKDHEGNAISGVQADVTYGIETWDGKQTSMQELGRMRVTVQGGIANVVAKATRPGYMVFRVEVRDRRGNVIISRPGVYVPGEGGWWGSEVGSLSVQMDKPKYEVGDPARAVILSPVDGEAWVTVEGDDVYLSRKVRLVKGGNLVDFQISAAHLPNAYFTVQMVRDAKYYEGSSEILVDVSSKRLNVSIEPERADYLPGETATYKITATDANGRPVVADLAFSVVDESIYAIRGDATDLVDAFYPMRYSEIETSYSFPDIFLGDGDKDDVEIDVRRRFLDTAHWDASVVTNAAGEATVAVDLPDNLTTWRATARGLSTNSDAGQGIAKVVVSKPLMVNLALPRAMTQGDEIEIAATISVKDQEMDVGVTLNALGVEFLDAARKSVNVAPRRPEVVKWRVKVPDPGSVKFTVLAVSGEPALTDAMESSIDVHARGRRVIGYAAGDTTATAQIPVDVNGLVHGSGSMEVVLGASLAANLSSSLEFLVGYPYGCIEQTLSRFVPSLAVAGSPLAEALPPSVRAELPAMIRSGLTRVRTMQASDGGWGWWSSDSSDPYFTGLVLEAYATAAAAGHPPSAESRSDAIEWSRGWLLTTKETALRPRLRLMRGLAAQRDVEAVQSGMAQTNWRSAIAAADWASIAMIAHAIGNAQMRQQAVAKLKAMAVVTQSHATWQGDWFTASPTAEAALALATVVPQDPLVGKAIRYLFTRQNNTADAAASVLAAARVASSFGATSGPRSVRILAGGKEVRVATVDSDRLTRFELPIDELADGDVSIEVSGGRVFWSAAWRCTLADPAANSGKAGDGLSVTRRYFRLRPRRLDTGELRLLPSGDPVTSVQAGDTVRVVVRINSMRDRELMMLEDPLPAGFEVLERSSDGIGEWEWFYWYSGLDVRDDRIVYFMRYLHKGIHTIEYTLRAEAPGKVTARPATVSGMYDVDDSAWTPPTVLEVRR